MATPKAWPNQFVVGEGEVTIAPGGGRDACGICHARGVCVGRAQHLGARVALGLSTTLSMLLVREGSRIQRLSRTQLPPPSRKVIIPRPQLPIPLVFQPL